MPQNDVDQWAAAATQSLQQTQAEQIRNSVGTALSTNPDQEAQTRRFAAAAMVPLETARALPDTVKQQAQMSTFDAGLLARKFPTTAQLVANPDMARITHDDIPATAGVEQAVRALPPAPAQSIDTPHPTQSSLLADAIHYIFSTPGQGDTLVGDAGKIVAGGARALAGTGKYLALADSTLARPIDAVLGTNLQQGALGLASKLDAYNQSGPGRDASFKDQLLSTVGSTAGVLGEAALTGGASVEPRLGATVMEALGPHIAHGVQAMMVPSAVAAQDTYNSVVEKTGNVVDATRAALASYVTSSLGGVVPFATPGKLAYRMASGALMGPLLGDVSHEVMNAAMPDSMQAPDLTWKERGLDAVMGTMFGGMAGPHDVADIHQRINDAARQSYVDAIRNEADVKSIAALHGLGQVSAVAKLRERDPEAFKQFVESVTEDGNLKEVYVDANTLTNALNQSGVTDADLQATMPDVLAQLHEASQTNGDVRIPVADYATHIAGGPIDEAILPHLKTDPEGKTYTEAQAAYQGQVESLKGTVDKMLADKGAQDTAQASRSAIRDQVLQQLNEVNRFRPDVNRLHAEVIADHRVTMAERLGMTPEQFSETYPLRFTGDTGEGGMYDQGGKLATESENFKAWFGDSKVVDAAGKPLVVYHGTAADFAEFKRTRGGEFGPAIYATDNPREAGEYGSGQQKPGVNVMPLYVSMFHPYTEGVDKFWQDFGKDDGDAAAIERARNAGYDGVIAKRADRYYDNDKREYVDRGGELTHYIVFDPTQVKSQFNRGTYDPTDPHILHQSGFDQTKTPEFKRWSNDAPLVTREDAKTHDFKTGEKIVVEAYHGTKRPDRVGTAFQKKRATSGPMAYHTSDPELASGYATGKSDTSLADEDQDYANWFKWVPPGQRSPVDIARAWYSLDAETKAKIFETAPTLRIDDQDEHVVSEEGNTSGNGSYDYNLQQTQRGGDRRGNPLEALVEDWLNSGNLFHNEELFMEVLQKAGFPVKEVTYDSPHAEYPFVYKNYIEMQKPLVTSEVPRNVVDALDAAAKKDRSRAQPIGADMWDKNTRTLREWVKTFHESENNAYVWTSIPDKVTGVFKSLGYDGIVDWSGKGGGTEHPVYIPFEETQVKSAIGNKGKFDASKKDILKQDARGQISFADDITQQPSVISLLKNADLSTTIHELGHFFLEVNNHLTRQIEARMANGEAATPGEQSVVNDMHTALSWMGVKPTPEMSATDHWAYLPLDEKRHFHENFARGFEAYMMEGKAPSVGLARAFQAFRSWLLNVYKSLTALHVELTPEVRGVFDRMLASDEAIKTAEQVRGYRPLFESASDAGMTPEEFSNYQGLGKEATADATDELQGRSLRDMKWLANAKSKALKDLQKEAAGKRQTAQQEVTKEVMSQPIYRAWTFLTAKDGDRVEGAAPVGDSKGVNPEKDNLFTAIAKLGGLDRAEVKKLWGIDPKEKLDSGVFGAPVVRKTGGLSTEAMAERLMEEGYLLPDEHGKADADKFEALFDDQRRGTDRYSIKRDMAASPLKVPELPEMGFGRLRTQDLRDMFGEGDDAAWRKLSKLRMTSDKGGLHPDIVAEMFGMESGRDLVQKLAEVENPKQVIEGMTDQRMLEQHGDLVDPRSIERAAEAAIHNEARARFVATELKALAKATGPARALALAAKEAADAAIAAKRVRDLRPAQYTAAEGRAARAAEKALVSGDMPDAAVEKRAQLLNNRLAKAATDALEEVRKGVQYLDKFDKPGVRVNIDLEYRDQIDALLDRYDLRKSTSGKALDKRGALLQFVDRMASQGYEPQIPEALLNEATRMHYKEMPVEDFRGLLDAVKSIEHLGRLKTRLLDLKEMREVQALADEARATTAELPQRAPESNRGLTRMESKWLGVKSAGRSMQAALLKMEQMFDWLDNRNPNGVFNRVVFRRISDAGVHEADLQAQVKAKIDALLHSHLADVTKDGGKIYVADGLIDGLTGKPQRFTKKEMLSLAGNMGNDSNTAKLVKGEKWDEAAVWDFLHKNMGKADWEFVAGLGKTLETLWPEKLAMSRRLGNTNPEKIQPRPFDTPHGPQPGWYWPMVYDPARSQDVAERGARAGDALFENIYSRANTDTGRMNTRSENYARPLLLSLDTIPRVIKDEIHDVAYREAIMDADKFLGHKDVRSAIQDALSPEHYDQLRPWLQSIANDRKVDMAALKWFDQVAHGARTRATIVGLGYRVSTMLVHGSSAAMESVAELGPKWMGAGLKDFANPLQWSANKDFVFERSGEMRDRMNEVDRDVREHLREIEIRLMDTTEGAVARGTDLMKARAYQGIAMLDMASALPTWMGAYHKAMAAEADGGLGMGEADAVYFADKTVRNAHGGTGAKDLAAVQRGPEFFKLFTMFYTFWNHNVNRLMDTARLAKSLPETFRTGEPGEFKGDLGRVIMRTLIYTLGVQAMHSMLYPSKDAEGDTNWLGWAAKEFTAAAFAGIPVLRDLSAHYLTGKDYAATPAAGIVQAVGNSGTDAMNAMLGKEASPKVLKHTVTTAGYVFGLPLGQPASTAQFLWDVSQGDQNPETVGDWLRGVMHGEMKHR